MCVYLKTDNKLTSMTKSMTTQSESVSAILNRSCAVLLFIVLFLDSFIVWLVSFCVLNLSPCARLSTQRLILVMG